MLRDLLQGHTIPEHQLQALSTRLYCPSSSKQELLVSKAISPAVFISSTFGADAEMPCFSYWIEQSCPAFTKTY